MRVMYVRNGRRRRGYARLALQHGAVLVPVFVFGGSELYGQALDVQRLCVLVDVQRL